MNTSSSFKPTLFSKHKNHNFKTFFTHPASTAKETFLEDTLNPKFHQNSQALNNELRNYYLSPKEKKLRKETIRIFFKPNDLDFYNLTKKSDFQQSSLNKNATLQEVFLSKKKTEEIFKTVKNKGNIYINDLWSEDYYKKVMKFAHLQEIIDDIKENQRKRNIKRKDELLKKFQLENSMLSIKITIFDHFDEMPLRKTSILKRITPDKSIKTEKEFEIVEIEKNDKKLRKLPQPNKRFIKEKIGNIKKIIDDCTHFNKDKKIMEMEYRGMLTERYEDKFQKKTSDLKNMKDLKSSLMNFFDLKRKSLGFVKKIEDNYEETVGLPPLLNIKQIETLKIT